MAIKSTIGITVSTALKAGGIQFNHAEGIVVSAPVSPSAGIVVRTAIVGGPKRIFIGGLS